MDDGRAASAANRGGAPADTGAGAATSGDSLSDAMAAAGVSLGDVDLDNLSPEERAQAEAYVRELAESRERLKAVPAAVVIGNHAMGIYELAALHLFSSQPPNFTEATVAIDALGVLLEGMKGRLGEAEPPLQEAKSQLQMAFVQLKQSHDSELSEPVGEPNNAVVTEAGADPNNNDPDAT